MCYIKPQIMLSRILIALSLASFCFAAAPDGAALYKTRCGTCHDGKAQLHMPSRDELVAKTPEVVFKAMTQGVMGPQAAGLSEDEERAIARFITGKEFSAPTVNAMAGQCTSKPKPLTIASTDWNGWGQDLGNSRY